MTAPILFDDTSYLSTRIEARKVSETEARNVSQITRYELERLGFIIRAVDPRKPWGAEIKLRGSPERAMKFLQHFFGDLEISRTLLDPVTPKILLIAQAERLSWHYHDRKHAHLRILHGHVGVSLSATDAETVPDVRAPGAYVDIPPLMRHRLSSLSGWAVIAEIGRDVVPDNPSDDEDTYRLRDDYDR